MSYQAFLVFQDIPTGAESCVTSIVSDNIGRSLLVVGCGDGSVRLFDRRLPPNDSRVMTLREHRSWVVNVVLERSTSESIISARYVFLCAYLPVSRQILLYLRTCISAIDQDIKP